MLNADPTPRFAGEIGQGLRCRSSVRLHPLRSDFRDVDAEMLGRLQLKRLVIVPFTGGKKNRKLLMPCSGSRICPLKRTLIAVFDLMAGCKESSLVLFQIWPGFSTLVFCGGFFSARITFKISRFYNIIPDVVRC
jgi:hypothetical protein